VGKMDFGVKIIREHIKGQSLATFIERLRQPIKTIIKASKPSISELAIKESLEEEQIYQSDKESQSYDVGAILVALRGQEPTRLGRICSFCDVCLQHHATFDHETLTV